MPITRGSTPATALATNAPSGSTPSSRAFSSLATTSAAAPSLIPLALPAVTVPPSRNAGFSAASFSALVSGRGCSSRTTLADRDELVVEPPGLARRRPAPLRLERERVLVLARDVPALGDVLARLAHRLEREHRLQPRVRERASRASCRRRPGCRAGTAVSGLRHGERRAAHRLDAAGDEQVAVAGDDRVAGRDDRGEARRAEPVDGHARDRLRAARRAARPSARRCGCPRRPGSRSRSRRPRSRSAGTPARSTAAAIASAARSSGRTPESAPP